MRILFGATPAPGHLLPLLPLADAAASAGHEVAFLTSSSMTPFLQGRRLLAAGPDFAALAARAGSGATEPGVDAAELFAGIRVDLTYDDAETAAGEFAPDLLIGESVDFVTPLLAARFGVPWIAHAIGGPLPAAFTGTMAALSRRQHLRRDLEPRPWTALLDPFPVALRGPADPPPEPWGIGIRPVAHRDRVPGAVDVEFPLTGLRPRVLVTTGTSVDDPFTLDTLARSLAENGAEVLVTAPPRAGLDRPDVHAIGFTPLATVLPVVDVVAGTAGSGTLLATLAHGLPSILLPRIADQPANAARAVAHHAAIAIATPAQAGPALTVLLANERYRAAARRLQASIARMPTPAEALGHALDRLTPLRSTSAQ